MSKNSYEQFFKAAQETKRSDTPPKDKIQFSLKSKTSVPPSRSTPTSKAQKAAHEQRLRGAVRMKAKKAPLPWKAVAGLVVSLGLAGFYVVAPDTFENLLNKVEFRAMGQAEAADAAAKDAEKKSAASPAEKSHSATGKAEKGAGGEAGQATAKSPDEHGTVTEDLSQFGKLKQRKEELDLREKELTELEEELQRQKVELDKRITQLEEMRNQIGQTLKDRVDVDQEKVNKLVDLYSNMKPKQASDIIAALNEELAVEILAKMKKKNAAEVMNLLPAEKARVLSEKYTGYRRISSQDPKGQ